MFSGETFAFETTLATKSYKNFIKKAKENGYEVILLFFWLQSVELAKERVKQRVIEGGHNIDNVIIERRYFNGIKNLFNIYFKIVDRLMIFDNSDKVYKLVAEMNEDDIFIYCEKEYQTLNFLSNEK